MSAIDTEIGIAFLTRSVTLALLYFEYPRHGAGQCETSSGASLRSFGSSG